ncbi:PREDICTED: uncharacterized protein LOC108774857 [Cyphomyrmex costatus]|uniref:uncharacterized protein LOC108774857 n=1 Tax=Cyphomyrmex costatus TaxID=456900 RepID=UPI000852226E|nr:PREDICTED: uncharacterized protein LOC108774857 [Cyphomyrmex costatus]
MFKLVLMAIAVVAVTCAPMPEPAPAPGPGPLPPLLAPYPVIYTAPYLKVYPYQPVPLAYYNGYYNDYYNKFHPGSAYAY